MQVVALVSESSRYCPHMLRKSGSDKSESVTDLIGRKWVLTSAARRREELDLAGCPTAYITFETTEKVSGFDGCNWFHGPVTLQPGLMEAGNVISTLIACVGPDGGPLPSNLVLPLKGVYSWTLASGRLTIRCRTASLSFSEDADGLTHSTASN